MPDEDPKPFTFRVVDATTRADLRDVALHRAPRWTPRGAQVEPLTEASRFASGDSPLALEPLPKSGYTTQIVVAAAGHALALVEVELAAGGELEVALARGGSLSVVIADVPAGVAAELRLHSVDGLRREWKGDGERVALIERGPRSDAPLDLVYASAVLRRNPFHAVALAGRSQVSFDALAPGSWVASLVVDVDGIGYCQDFALVTVAPEREATVPLRWRNRPAPKRVRIHGHVDVAPGWELVPSTAPWVARLERESVDPALGSDGMFMEQVETRLVATATPLRFHFDFGDHPAGAYTFLLPRFSVALPLQADESRERLVAIPPPVEVELTLLPPLGERPVADRRVRWGVAAGRRALRHVAAPAEPDLVDGRHHFVAPQGTVVVMASALHERFGGDLEAFQVAPGAAAITLRIRPTPLDLVITLKDGARALPMPWRAKIRIERDGHAVGRGHSFSPHGTEVRFSVPGPGRYCVTVSDVEGYEDSPPVEVDVKADPDVAPGADRRRRNAIDVAMRRRP